MFKAYSKQCYINRDAEVVVYDTDEAKKKN
jgi:hypothetical protein